MTHVPDWARYPGPYFQASRRNNYISWTGVRMSALDVAESAGGRTARGGFPNYPLPNLSVHRERDQRAVQHTYALIRFFRQLDELL